jgi:hypothetical protein
MRARPHVLLQSSPAFHFTRVEREAERLDQVQLRPECESAARRVPGVPRDLGPDQREVEVGGGGGARRGHHFRS